MFSRVTSVVLVGAEPRRVDVEVFVGGSTPKFQIVGLPDAAVREAKQRVLAALKASSWAFPDRRVIVNLAPADVPKGGSAYDLPIAIAVLVAAGLVPEQAANVVALGELALNGQVRPVRGGLGAARIADQMELPCLLPPESAAEALAIGESSAVVAVRRLDEAVAVALGDAPGGAIPQLPVYEKPAADLTEVRGQALVRRALEIAAAGGHHMLMTGPPGGGKTMIARCLPGILPDLTGTDVVATALTWAAAGLARPNPSVAPFRSPHHSASLAALIGGGSGIPVPGEAALAHNGVLFLDELGEFPVHHLDALRQPMEERHVVVARKGASVRFDTGFQLVAATNPCPCGYEGDRLRSCSCTPGALAKYQRRLSGPLVDRFDIVVRVERVRSTEMAGGPGESSAEVARRVAAARKRQTARGMPNARLRRGDLDRLHWHEDVPAMLKQAMHRSALTARGWDRVRRVAATIADLAGSELILGSHIGEALAYRGQR